jgi:hypothetical protein
MQYLGLAGVAGVAGVAGADVTAASAGARRSGSACEAGVAGGGGRKGGGAQPALACALEAGGGVTVGADAALLASAPEIVQEELRRLRGRVAQLERSQKAWAQVPS